ncbi:hypothetical protein HYV80_03125, partial [Candidatus Woesearchaeota archaeon]|nr:hypothetical protein [Candidatus Woesearchaeota archaeon]
MNSILVESRLKTAHVKKFVPIRAVLEGRTRRWLFKGILSHQIKFSAKDKHDFQENVELFKRDLAEKLSSQDIEKLMKLEYYVPEGALILFLPFIDYTIIGLNLNNVEELFKSQGWVTHATNDDGLKQVAKDGYLKCAVETIRSIKKYPTRFKFSNASDRIMAGISFSYQEFGKYTGYMARTPERDAVNVLGYGGFFVFSIENLLEERLKLDFRGIDSYPEITLVNMTSAQSRSGINSRNIMGKSFAILLSCIREYESILKNIENYYKIFEYLKRNKEKLNQILGFAKIVSEDARYDKYFQTVVRDIMRYLRIIEENKILYVLSYIDSEPRLIPDRYERYKDFYQKDGRTRFYREYAFVYEDSEFLRFLSMLQKDYNIELNYKFLSLLQYCLNKNDLFYFVILFYRPGSYYSYERIMPRYYTYSNDQKPFYLDNTIFHLPPYSYLNPNEEETNWPLTFLVSLLQIEKDLISPNIQKFLAKLSLKEIIRLIKKTRHKIIQDFEILAEKYSQSSPIKIPINKGVLFLPNHFFKFNGHELILQELLKLQTPVIFPINIENGFKQVVLEIIHNLLMAKDFDIRGTGVNIGDCYFTVKESLGRK